MSRIWRAVAGLMLISTALPCAAYWWEDLRNRDVNRDWVPDVILQRSTDGQAIAWFLTSAGVKTSGVSIASLGGATWEVRGARDVNRDGVGDLIVRHTTDGQLKVFFLSAAGAVLSNATVTTAPGSAWDVKAVCGVRDEYDATDLILQRSSDGLVRVWSLNYNGTLKSATDVAAAPGSSWVVRGAACMTNYFSAPDLILRRTTDGQLIRWTVNTNGVKTTSGAISTAPGSIWDVKGVGDLNWDMNPDVVLQRSTDGQVIVWFLDEGGNKTGGAAISTAPGSMWEVCGVADVNGDFVSDLILRRTTDGQLIVWFVDRNGAKTSGVAVSAAPGSTWNVKTIAGYGYPMP